MLVLAPVSVIYSHAEQDDTNTILELYGYSKAILVTEEEVDNALKELSVEGSAVNEVENRNEFQKYISKKNVEELKRRSDHLSECMFELEMKKEDYYNTFEVSNFEEVVATKLSIESLQKDIEEISRSIRSYSIFDIDLSEDVEYSKLDEARRKYEELYKSYMNNPLVREVGMLSIPSRYYRGFRVTSDLGYREDPFTGESTYHTGVDYAAAEGTPIRSILSGTVVQESFNDGLGNYIVLKHGDDMYTVFGHMVDRTTLSVGEEVIQGDVLGFVGNTGRSTGPHVHISLKIRGNYEDIKYILN